MHMSAFLASHPEATSGAPPWRWAVASALTTVLGVVAAVSTVLWALGGLQSPDAAPMLAFLAAILVGVASTARLPRALARVAYLRGLARDGRRCYAVTDDELFVTDDGGRGLLVELDQIVELILDGDELRLRVDDADAQGVVYAVLFGCFDDDGPSPGPCFDALAARLRARRSPARIEPCAVDV